LCIFCKIIEPLAILTRRLSPAKVRSSTHCPAPLIIFHGHQSIIDPIHNTLTYMAGGSASSSGSFIHVVLQPTTLKLGKNNHTTWCVQILTTLHGARLDGYVTGKKKAPATELEEKQGDQKVMVVNPEYEDWLASDQQVSSFILASVSKEILAQIATATTAAQAWEKLEEQFTSQTRACAITTRMDLAMSHKGSLSVTEYLAKMQDLANDMAAAGKST
jgi:hypothetical protein